MTTSKNIKAGLLKTLAIVVLCTGMVLVSDYPSIDEVSASDGKTLMLAMVLITLIVPVQAKIYSFLFGTKLEKPEWNKHFFKVSRILGLLQFGATYIIFKGIVVGLISVVEQGTINLFGVALIGIGTALMFGTHLSKLWT